MRIYNNYIISLAVITCLLNVLLAFFGLDNLEIYFIANLIAYLVITLLYVYLNPRARKALGSVSAVAFTGFLVIVAIRVLEILAD